MGEATVHQVGGDWEVVTVLISFSFVVPSAGKVSTPRAALIFATVLFAASMKDCIPSASVWSSTWASFMADVTMRSR